MKLNKIEQIVKKTELDCDVMEVTLLSEAEYERCREIIPLVDKWWWLRSPRLTDNRVASVYADGGWYYYSYYFTGGGVRPALWIKISNSASFKVSDTIELFGITWTVLGAMGGQIYILADKAIARRRFDSNSNVWAESELKKWLEEWLEDRLESNNE